MSQQMPPGGWAPQPGQQPQQGQWGQQPGAPQDQGAPQPTVMAGPGYPPGYQAPSAQPAAPGFMHALTAPAGAHKVLWIGALLMIVSFAAKQILVDVSVSSIGGLIEVERLRAKQRAEISEIDAAFDPVDTEIADLEFNAPEPPKMSEPPSFTPGAPPPPMPDFSAFEAKKKEFDEKMEKLKKKRADLDKDLEPKRKKVRQEYRPKIVEAERTITQSGASAIGRAQTTITLKLLVDLVKLFGGAMVVLSALRISTDSEHTGGAKAYAAVLGGIAFVSMVIGGLYSALFG